MEIYITDNKGSPAKTTQNSINQTGSMEELYIGYLKSLPDMWLNLNVIEFPENYT